jgi:hypothetical protein
MMKDTEIKITQDESYGAKSDNVDDCYSADCKEEFPTPDNIVIQSYLPGKYAYVRRIKNSEIMVTFQTHEELKAFIKELEEEYA